MIKKGIIALVAIVAAVGLVFAAYGDAENETSNDSKTIQQPEDDNSSENTSTDTTIIPASQAKKLAGKYIEEPGATAGTPELVTSGDRKIYLVPVIYNGEPVGEIEIDAVTGENLGGAGGAP
jgi:uncharacterized membrane protein YkoI